MRHKYESTNNYKIEYFLNVVFYFLWRMHLYVFSVIEKIHNFLSWPINKLWISLSSYKQKRKAVIRQKNLHALVKDVKSGMEIGEAKRDMRFIFFPYCACLSFNIISWLNDIFDLSQTLSPIICLGIAAIMFFPYDNLLTKYIYSEDRYLYYFEIFETEDKRWYRKWKWITIALGLGGWALIFITGFVYCIIHPD